VADGPLKHSGDLHAYLQELGVTEATGQDIAQFLQGGITVADTTHLVAPAHVPVAGLRFDLTPAAGLVAVFEAQALPPAKGIWLTYLEIKNSDIRFAFSATSHITAGLAIVGATVLPSLDQGRIQFTQGTNPASLGGTTFNITGSDLSIAPIWVPVGVIMQMVGRVVAQRTTVEVMVQEVP